MVYMYFVTKRLTEALRVSSARVSIEKVRQGFFQTPKTLSYLEKIKGLKLITICSLVNNSLNIFNFVLVLGAFCVYERTFTC